MHDKRYKQTRETYTRTPESKCYIKRSFIIIISIITILLCELDVAET